MGPDKSDIHISDVVVSAAGRDKGSFFYVVGEDAEFLYLADGKGRTQDAPKKKKRKHVLKVLRSETRAAEKLLSGSKVPNSELRRDLAFAVRQLQANDLGG